MFEVRFSPITQPNVYNRFGLTERNGEHTFRGNQRIIIITQKKKNRKTEVVTKSKGKKKEKSRSGYSFPTKAVKNGYIWVWDE